MKKEWVVTQQTFDSLLIWLDEDREQAGLKYEKIRLRLIKIFTCRGCAEAEDLADEVINRVVSRVGALESTYQGDPALYPGPIALSRLPNFLTASSNNARSLSTLVLPTS